MSFRTRILTFTAAALLWAGTAGAQGAPSDRVVVGTLRSAHADRILDVDGRRIQAEPNTAIVDLHGQQRSWGDVQRHVGQGVQVQVGSASAQPTAEVIVLGPPPE